MLNNLRRTKRWGKSSHNSKQRKKTNCFKFNNCKTSSRRIRRSTRIKCRWWTTSSSTWFSKLRNNRQAKTDKTPSPSTRNKFKNILFRSNRLTYSFNNRFSRTYSSNSCCNSHPTTNILQVNSPNPNSWCRLLSRKGNNWKRPRRISSRLISKLSIRRVCFTSFRWWRRSSFSKRCSNTSSSRCSTFNSRWPSRT